MKTRGFICPASGGAAGVGTAEDLAGSLPKILRAFSRQHPGVRIEVEIGIGMDLFSMMQARTLDPAIGGVCVDQVGGRTLFKEPLAWAFAAELEVPDPLPLAFFPEPGPYREAALRALASTQRDWHIACTSASLAGVGRRVTSTWPKDQSSDPAPSRFCPRD